MNEIENALIRLGYSLTVGKTYIDINITKNDVLTITERPAYCDRGRYMVQASTSPTGKYNVDSADFFPNYYFSDDALVSEVDSWVTFRTNK